MQSTENLKKDKINSQGPNGVIPVVALALFRKSDRRYLMAQRSQGQSGQGDWEFPGGKIEENETQQQALVREIKEELSLELDMNQLKYIAENQYSYPNKTIHLFLWSYEIGDTVIELESLQKIKLLDHDQIAWFLPNEMNNYQISAADRVFLSLLPT